MSKTTSQTSRVGLPTKENQAPAQLTILTRVAQIPLVSSSLTTLNDKLSSNAYTRSSYFAAKDLSSSAYQYAQPLQTRLAPLIVRADGMAHKAVDVVQSRYPYPFHAKPEEVASYVQEKRNSAVTALDARVRSPAYSVAQGLDQSLAPLVNYIEVAVSRLHNNTDAGPSKPPAAATSDSQYQYQRAYALSQSLKDQLLVYSSEQLKHLQAQNVLVQRATETAQSLQSVAASSLLTANAHLHTLTAQLLSELQNAQQSALALSSSTSQHLHATSQSVHDAATQSYADLSRAIGSFREILGRENVGLQEKVGMVGEQVRPVLEGVQARVAQILSQLSGSGSGSGGMGGGERAVGGRRGGMGMGMGNGKAVE